jgi:hypothetical protein
VYGPIKEFLPAMFPIILPLLLTFILLLDHKYHQYEFL